MFCKDIGPNRRGRRPVSVGFRVFTIFNRDDHWVAMVRKAPFPNGSVRAALAVGTVPLTVCSPCTRLRRRFRWGPALAAAAT